LTLALPTGRILEEILPRLAGAGLTVPRDELRARRLRITAGERLSLILVKDRDVPTYVEHGVADLGVAGRDILAETEPEVFQPLDLGLGRCRMVVARRQDAPPGLGQLPVVRVATKYTQVAVRHFHGRGIPIELIPLAGSVEVAPLLGLADCIVDVVQTGKTLAANDLVEDELLFESTARLIVNRAAFRLKRREIVQLIQRFRESGP
jgi:ATP phosphoribosyltransferase